MKSSHFIVALCSLATGVVGALVLSLVIASPRAESLQQQLDDCTATLATARESLAVAEEENRAASQARDELQQQLADADERAVARLADERAAVDRMLIGKEFPTLAVEGQYLRGLEELGGLQLFRLPDSGRPADRFERSWRVACQGTDSHLVLDSFGNGVVRIYFSAPAVSDETAALLARRVLLPFANDLPPDWIDQALQAARAEYCGKRAVVQLRRPDGAGGPLLIVVTPSIRGALERAIDL